MDHLQFDQSIGQQLHGPADAARWRGGASQDHQLRFLRSVQLAILPIRGRLAMERRLQALLDQTLSRPMHRRQTHADQFGDLLV